MMNTRAILLISSVALLGCPEEQVSPSSRASLGPEVPVSDAGIEEDVLFDPPLDDASVNPVDGSEMEPVDDAGMDPDPVEDAGNDPDPVEDAGMDPDPVEDAGTVLPGVPRNGNPDNPFNFNPQKESDSACTSTSPPSWLDPKDNVQACAYDDLREFYDAYIGPAQTGYRQLAFTERRPGCYSCMVSSWEFDSGYSPAILTAEGNVLINWSSATADYNDADDDEAEKSCAKIQFNLTQCQQYECWEKTGTEFYTCVRQASHIAGACSSAYYGAVVAATKAGGDPIPASGPDDSERGAFVNMAWRSCGLW